MLPHERHNALLGQMRCLASLAEWERLSELCRWEDVQWGFPPLTPPLSFPPPLSLPPLLPPPSLLLFSITSLPPPLYPPPSPPRRHEWRKSEPHMRREMGMLAAHAAWHMNHWDEMLTYVDTVDSPEPPQSQTAAGAFLRAVLCIRHDSFDLAKVD
jgi:hypothetical protein